MTARDWDLLTPEWKAAAAAAVGGPKPRPPGAVDLDGLVAALASERQRRGWSQSELARRAGLSRSYIQKLESRGHDPNVSTLIACAGGLGLTLGWVVAPVTTER